MTIRWNESQKLFVMDNFQIRFVATVTILLSVRVQCPLLLCFYENSWKQPGRKLFSVIWSVLRDDNLIQFRSRVQIGFGFVFGIVELLRTSDFALFSVSLSDEELSLEASVYAFSFSEESSVTLSGNVIVRVTGRPGSKCRRQLIRLHICF